ncbi:ZIP family metal transporter [Actinospica robiniae]|uniref:ZIP family metal transporter n=1 Tax=Actinospica robiniae TaxID=304901 RepID=UPI00041035A8|nr:hypothetical protein [Actinospica robiniae]
MGSHLARAGLLVLFPIAAAVLGSLAAARRPPGPKFTSGVQHFAAGVVFAAAAVEVVPQLQASGHLPAAVVGFCVGVAILLGLQAAERRTEKAAEISGRAGFPTGMLVAIAVDLVIDGVLVGIGATLGANQGMILTVALTLEIGFLALAVTSELRESLGMLKAAAIASSLSLAVPIGALIAVVGLAHAPAWLFTAVLAAGIAALMFLVAEELITEAHEEAPDTPILTAMFFAGFIILYVLDRLGG